MPCSTIPDSSWMGVVSHTSRDDLCRWSSTSPDLMFSRHRTVCNGTSVIYATILHAMLGSFRLSRTMKFISCIGTRDIRMYMDDIIDDDRPRYKHVGGCGIVLYSSRCHPRFDSAMWVAQSRVSSFRAPVTANPESRFTNVCPRWPRDNSTQNVSPSCTSHRDAHSSTSLSVSDSDAPYPRSSIAFSGIYPFKSTPIHQRGRPLWKKRWGRTGNLTRNAINVEHAATINTVCRLAA